MHENQIEIHEKFVNGEQTFIKYYYDKKCKKTDRNYNEEHEYAAAMKSAIYEQHRKENFRFRLNYIEETFDWSDYVVHPDTDKLFIETVLNYQNLPKNKEQQIALIDKINNPQLLLNLCIEELNTKTLNLLVHLSNKYNQFFPDDFSDFYFLNFEDKHVSRESDMFKCFQRFNREEDFFDLAKREIVYQLKHHRNGEQLAKFVDLDIFRQIEPTIVFGFNDADNKNNLTMISQLPIEYRASINVLINPINNLEEIINAVRQSLFGDADIDPEFIEKVYIQKKLVEDLELLGVKNIESVDVDFDIIRSVYENLKQNDKLNNDIEKYYDRIAPKQSKRQLKAKL